MGTVYTAIENPGPLEKQILADRPDWVELFPQRILEIRASDEYLRNRVSHSPFGCLDPGFPASST